MRGNVCLRVDVCWLIWLIFDGCCIFSYIMKQLEISALDLLLLSNTELLIVVSMNVYIRIRWTLPLSPSNIHPRLYRSIDYMFFSSILAHHRPTKISKKKKNMLRSYKSSSFFSKSDGCFVFHNNHVTTSGKDFWEFVAWKYPGPQGSSWKYPGDLNRSGRWSWGSQWIPPGFSIGLQGLAPASSCLGYILYMGIILHSYIYMCGW